MNRKYTPFCTQDVAQERDQRMTLARTTPIGSRTKAACAVHHELRSSAKQMKNTSRDIGEALWQVLALHPPPKMQPRHKKKVVGTIFSSYFLLLSWNLVSSTLGDAASKP